MIISFYLISIYITNRILIIYYKIAPPSLRSREGGRGDEYRREGEKINIIT
jgi:hypothetical protein